jgi:hypothetical protein
MKDSDRLREKLEVIRDEISSLFTVQCKEVLELIKTKDDEDRIMLYEFEIPQPIFNKDVNDDNFSETISEIFYYGGEVCFSVDTVGGGYEITIRELDVDMLIHLLGVVEEINKLVLD